MAQRDVQAALKEALEIELRGKEFYTKARDTSKHKLGKEIFAHLVKEEDVHLLRIREVFDALQKNPRWPQRRLLERQTRDAGALFGKMIARQEKRLKGDADDLKALATAKGLEEKNETFYRELAKKATDNFEREFFETLAAEERGHYQLVGDTLHYLEDPETWYQEKEKAHFDGA